MANWGASLPVPKVQAFVEASELCQIPERYIRPEAQSDPAIQANNEKLPIIDLELLSNPEFCDEEHAKLDLACQEWGFFQVSLQPLCTGLVNSLSLVKLQYHEINYNYDSNNV